MSMVKWPQETLKSPMIITWCVCARPWEACRPANPWLRWARRASWPCPRPPWNFGTLRSWSCNYVSSNWQLLLLEDISRKTLIHFRWNCHKVNISSKTNETYFNPTWLNLQPDQLSAWKIVLNLDFLELTITLVEDISRKTLIHFHFWRWYLL